MKLLVLFLYLLALVAFIVGIICSVAGDSIEGLLYIAIGWIISSRAEIEKIPKQ